jgi:TolB-like protein
MSSEHRPSARRSCPLAIDQLSPRKLEVLELLSKGLSNQDISGVVGISLATVRSHVAALLADLDVSNRAEAAAAFSTWNARPARVGEILRRPALGVLPVVPLDEQRSTRTLAAGITQDLASLFARWCWFPVIGGASSGDRLPGESNQDVGARLGVRFLVDASLRTARSTRRLTVRIDDVCDGHTLWTERFDFPCGNLFEVEDTVTETIVARAYPALTMQLGSWPVARRRPEDVQAWELAYEGMALYLGRSSTQNREARACFRAAIERDPTLTLAHHGLGLASYDELLNRWGPPGAAVERLTACARRCIELAPHAAEGYYLLGRHFQARGDHAYAARTLETAISKNPSFAPAHALLAQTLTLTGRSDEGLARMKHAVQLGPNSYLAGLSVVHFVRGEYGEALVAAESALATNPGYGFAHAMAAASAWWAGDRGKCRGHVQELHRAAPNFSAGEFLRTFGKDVDGVDRVARALEAAVLLR